jgi:hypothetical protein
MEKWSESLPKFREAKFAVCEMVRGVLVEVVAYIDADVPEIGEVCRYMEVAGIVEESGFDTKYTFVLAEVAQHYGERV